ncbi:protein of unknown function [Candidatus Promineifilum breve]|uniref:Uncharacterized protein n=1 Tax=Candidatus Promineifilum breve TaxID=1806508 RepID=A0A160T397_9CHLR|nr:protein of unknown function [Candidatus Promineifilum breve]
MRYHSYGKIVFDKSMTPVYYLIRLGVFTQDFCHVGLANKPFRIDNKRNVFILLVYCSRRFLPGWSAGFYWFLPN